MINHEAVYYLSLIAIVLLVAWRIYIDVRWSNIRLELPAT